MNYLNLLSTSQETGSASSNKTGLLTLGSVAGDRGCFTDVLVVTTTVGYKVGRLVCFNDCSRGGNNNYGDPQDS